MITLVSEHASSCGLRGKKLKMGAVATMNPATMETLQLFRGDTIIVRYVHRLHAIFVKF